MMANPQDSGAFETWRNSRLPIDVLPPKSGNTGGFEHWLSSRMPIMVYVAAATTPSGSVRKQNWQGGYQVQEGGYIG